MLTRKIDKVVPLKWGKGRSYVSVLREHYLRDDIPCHCLGCPICDNNSTAVLSSEVDHYAIPDGEVLSQFLDVFEHPSLTGLIITQTAANHVRTYIGHRSYSRLVNTISHSSKESVLFCNEHQIECFSSQQPHETAAQWKQRLFLQTVVWYSTHLEMIGLSPHIKIIVVTNNIPYYRDHLKMVNVEVSSLPDYLHCYWPKMATIHALYESLVALQMKKMENGSERGYEDHVSLDNIKQGTAEGRYITGTLRVNRYHPREEAFVTPGVIFSSSSESVLEDSSSRDILIPGMNLRNRAIHGDKVAIELLPTKEWKGKSRALPSNPSSSVSHDKSCDMIDPIPTGRVIGIIHRTDREIVSSFPEEGFLGTGKTEKVLVIPYDFRLPKIRLSTSLASQLRNHRIVVRIDKWEATSQYPDGHFVRTIGPIGNVETEIQAILIEYELSVGSFSQAVLSELPKGEGWKVDEDEVARRRDLRQTHLIFSIDPKGCEDVDDTLSVRQLKKGRIEFGVHIADVSYFVKSDSHTDKEAKNRSTSVYMPDRRYDMLPEVLSGNLCSLHSNVDRYAVSVMWKLSPNYEVEKVWYGRTVIRSAYKLTYEIAQDLFDGQDPSRIIPEIPELKDSSLSQQDIQQRLSELTSAIRQLVDISRILRERRNNEGALELEGVEIRVQMGEKNNIEDLIPKQPLEMHETVAECMIFANHWLAKKLFQSFPSRALLRHHPQPEKDRFSALCIAAAAKGYSIDTSSNYCLAQSLNMANDPQDIHVNKILRMLATHAMVQANYFSTGSLDRDQFYHYGLGLDLYTHFTSPIRRYADLIVHRQLLRALEEQLPSDIVIPSNTELAELCQHMNKKKRSAQLAQLASTTLFQALYFLGENEQRNESEAIIFSIRANGVIAYLPRYGIQGSVYLKDKSGLVLAPPDDGIKNTDGPEMTEGTLVFTDHHITVTHTFGKYTLKLFDHIRVKVNVEHGHTHPHSFSMELLSTVPIPMGNNSNISDWCNKPHSNPDLVKIVKSEASKDRERSLLLSDKSQEMKYYTSNCSLYTIIENMKRVGLSDGTR